MDCSLPGSSVHGILQARILEWIAIPFTTNHPDFLAISKTFLSAHAFVGGVPGLPGAPQDEAGLTRKFETSHVGGSLAPHERLPEILVVPREKTPTGAAARGNP